MPHIEETISKAGFAWIDSDNELNWAWAEDLEDIDPKDRPEGCTPVMIEISPADEWVDKKRKDYEYLGDLSENLNALSAELQLLQKSMRAQE
jgi:hypothetical protein